MNDQAKPASCPWRRFLRFSVRGLIVLVLAIGASLGWIVRSARIQHDAVAAIETDGGGEVAYDWDRGAGTTDFRGKPPVPRWLVDLVGIDYFGRVRFVVLWDARPATIAAVSRFTGLRRLGINGRGLRDTDLAPLRSPDRTLRARSIRRYSHGRGTETRERAHKPPRTGARQLGRHRSGLGPAQVVDESRRIETRIRKDHRRRVGQREGADKVDQARPPWYPSHRRWNKIHTASSTGRGDLAVISHPSIPPGIVATESPGARSLAQCPS